MKDLKSRHIATEGISIPTRGELSLMKIKKSTEGMEAIDPWEKIQYEYDDECEVGTRQYGSLASTQLSSAFNGHSLGKSAVANSDQRSRSGVLKLSSVDDNKQNRKSEFSGNSSASGIYSKVTTTTAIKRFDPGLHKTVSSSYTKRFNVSIKEQMSSTSNLEKLKNHKMLRTQGSLVYSLVI